AGEIFALYVLGEVQRQGIGTELTRRALDLLADHPVVALWVLDGNEKAIRFYEKTGFRFDGAEQTLQLGEPRTARRMLFAR
ncbi:MAG: GNAT family N-acetyltransferase, partial [Clostridia bacterium]|nr:GNAT family N-acetyltransferase [Clostridia bacterium]